MDQIFQTEFFDHENPNNKDFSVHIKYK